MTLQGNDEHESSGPAKTVLLTGATGYIGGRLGPRLLDAGYRVRCLVRDAAKLRARPWASSATSLHAGSHSAARTAVEHADAGQPVSEQPPVEIVTGDLYADTELASKLRGCAYAFYLVHSMMSAGSAYRERDNQMAKRFARAASEAGVERIIYLGGLGETGADLSAHLASRREVEGALASTDVPVTVLRAAMIIGSGSASFEILRYLVERLPVMVTPRWVRTSCQPIAVSNVLSYLVQSLATPETTGRTLEIGGSETMTYEEIMQTMASARGLPRRRIVPVPVLTPRLSSLWIHLVTPVSASIARPLAEGLRNRVVCHSDEAARLMPQPLLGVRASIEAALQRVAEKNVSTYWTDAGPMPGDPDWAGGTVFEDTRTTEINAPPESVYHAICRVGGGHGYYAADWLWRLRGWMDRLAGGPGLRRGRRHPETVSYGDALDFWRVTGVETNARLELRAEMKLPGEAELSFHIEPLEWGDTHRSRLTQTARFKPRGLAGLAYWYAVLPVHNIVFQGMLTGIQRESSSTDARESPETH